MTSREFFERIIEGATVTKELADYAEEAINKLNKKNAARKSATSKKQKENEPLLQVLKEFFLENPETMKTASEIGESYGYSSQKATALLRKLVEDNFLNVNDVKIKGKGKVKGYSLKKEELED